MPEFHPSNIATLPFDPPVLASSPAQPPSIIHSAVSLADAYVVFLGINGTSGVFHRHTSREGRMGADRIAPANFKERGFRPSMQLAATTKSA